MRARTLARAAGATLLTGLVLLAAGAAPDASADPCGCGGGYGRGYSPRSGCRTGYGYGYDRGYGRSRYGRCLERIHEDRFLARGQGWQLLRRYLHRIRIEPTHVHPRYYFQQRWLRPADGLRWGGYDCIGHDYPITECPLVAAAMGGDEEVVEATRDLSPADRLDRGMERFFRSAWAEAEKDFDDVAQHDPEDARACYGRFLCRVMQNDFPGAVARMRTLVTLDALDAHDRLDVESTFHDPEAFASFRRGLEDLTRWSFLDTDAQVVAGWTCAATGDEEGARRHWKAALRFAPDLDVATHLLASLDAPARAAPEPEPAAQPQTTPRETPAAAPPAPAASTDVAQVAANTTGGDDAR